MEEKRNFKSSMMTGSQLAIYQVESFLEESYLFRRRKDRVHLHQTSKGTGRRGTGKFRGEGELRNKGDFREEGVGEERSDSKEGGEP